MTKNSLLFVSEQSARNTHTHTLEYRENFFKFIHQMALDGYVSACQSPATST